MKILGRLILSAMLLVFSVSPYAAVNSSDANVIIFVSFSMPNASIKGWMNEAEKIHAPVVIRGLVNNSFKETIKKVSELAHDNHGGVQLDPTLFQRYQVKQVPAVVIRKPVNCPRTQTCQEPFDIVYGEAHLDYALTIISKKNDELSPIAVNYINKLRERMHG